MRKSGSQQMPTSPKGARGPSPAHKPPKPKIQKFSKMPEDTNKIAEAKENMVLLTNSQGAGLWCHVKEEIMPPQEQKRKGGERRKEGLTEYVDRKVEKELYVVLEGRVREMSIQLDEQIMSNQMLHIGIEKRKQSELHLLMDQKVANEKYELCCQELEAAKSQLMHKERSQQQLSGELESRIKEGIGEEKRKTEKYNELYEKEMRKGDKERMEWDKGRQQLLDEIEDYAEANQILESKIKELLLTLEQQNKLIPKGEEEVILGVPGVPGASGTNQQQPATKGNNALSNLSPSEKIKELMSENVGLRKRLTKEGASRRQMHNVVNGKEQAITKLNADLLASKHSLETGKSELQYVQSNLAQKSSQVKILEAKIKELQAKLIAEEKSNEANKHIHPSKATAKSSKRVNKPIKSPDEASLEPVKAKPFLFGPEDDLNF